MASFNNVVTVTIEADYAVGVVQEALRVANDALELVPEWNTMERQAIEARIAAVSKVAVDGLKTKYSYRSFKGIDPQ